MENSNSASDRAIVIGIKQYPNFGLEVQSAVEDARHFHDWLISDGVPPDNVMLFTESVTQNVIDVFFNELVAAVREGNQIGRRLYIYVTGMGIHDHEETLLTASDATEKVVRAFAIREYADYFARAGAFQDVVLIADLVGGKDLRQAYRHAPRLGRIVAERHAATFYVIADSSRGLLTRVLLEGLCGGAISDGALTSETLNDYLTSHWLGPAPRIEFSRHRQIFFTPPNKTSEKETRKPAPAERVRTHSDDPAQLDELGRRPFAEVLGQRLDEVWAAARSREDPGAFILNVDGPWGSGKTSVLNLLREYLQDGKRDRKQQWVIVEFNAWRQQRRRPPWWILIREVYRQSTASSQQIGFVRSLGLRMQWLFWRIRADWMPAFAAAVLITIAAILTVQSVTSTVNDSAPKSVELALKIIVAVGAAGAAVLTFTRSLAFGSARAAQVYADLRSDPLGPMVMLFERLVRAIRNPVVIFIDDVDRCESAYVVELLEGIQTLFRSAPVGYVIAADRRWIVTSFEKAYENFSKSIGEAGRPLGYLFLEKVFQVSASLPRLSQQVRQRYWSGLLLRGGMSVARDEERKKAEETALESVRGLRTKEELEAKIEEVKGDPVREPAMRAAAAKQITSVEAQQALTHRLEPCAELLDSNPRAMKRLVNAFGFHQATHFLEGKSVPAGALARWTIIELRWPLLSDYLAANPSKIAEIGDGKNATAMPEELKKLFTDADVRQVVAGGPTAFASLDEASVRAIVGM